jgi:hypothetical protein
MRVFIGGVMQASNYGKVLVDQSYRTRIAEALLARWPETEVLDPYALHPRSVDYDDGQARATLFGMMELAARSDLLIAFVPTASMGTALEMYVAYESGVPVITVSPLAENWVVKSLSRRVFPDIETLLTCLASSQSLGALAGAGG